MVHDWMECYTVVIQPNDYDPNNINILYSEGSRVVKGSISSNDKFLNPLRTKKVNIGSLENPKFSNIGDYWDDEIVGEITDLLPEFQYLFPTKFS